MKVEGKNNLQGQLGTWGKQFSHFNQNRFVKVTTIREEFCVNYLIFPSLFNIFKDFISTLTL